jgi:thiamine biosynthesis lipoprotein
MKKILLIVLFLLSGCSEVIQKDPVIRHIEAFGTTLQVSIYDTAATPVMINRGLRKFEEYVNRISWLTDADSGELARINLSTESWVTPNDTLASIIKKGLAYSRRSKGLYDITIRPVLELYRFGDDPVVPDTLDLKKALAEVGYEPLKWEGKRFYKDHRKIDLSRLRKGYALTHGADILRHAGIRDFLINAEGIVQFDWQHPDVPATIYIRHPRNKGKFFGKVTIAENSGLATAADYQTMVTTDRGKIHALISPRTGKPFNGMISVSVLTGNAQMADFYSTWLYLLGPARAKIMVTELPGVEALLIWRENGKLKHWVSDGLADSFELIKSE